MTNLAIGASNLLSGFEFSSGIELQNNIRDYLVSLGWVVLADDILTTGVLEIKAIASNGHECEIIFTSVVESDRQYLSIQGRLEEQLSPSLELDYNLGYPNRFWLMADNDSGGICLRNRFTYSGGISFGFLERIDESDPHAWMIAYTNNRLNDAYVAKSKHNNTIWHRIGDSYFNADMFSSVGLNGAYQGILDFAIALPLGSFTASSVANAGFFAHIGSLNGTDNQALVTRRFYLEGEEDPQNYSDSSQFYFRGFIKHFYNGFGSIASGGTFSDTTGNTYITTGGDGWQGLKIISQTPPEVTELPVIYHSFQVLNSDRGLSEIKNALTSLDWVVDSEEIDSSGNRILTLQAQYFDKDEYCYLNLKSISTTNTIEIKAELREDISSTGLFSFSFLFSEITNIRLSANAQALAMVITSNGVNTPLYFGFYGGRIDPNDKYAWGFGRVGTDLNQMWVAKSKLTGEVWQSIGSQFNFSLSKRSSYPVNGIGDRLSVPLLPFDYFNNTDSRNAARSLTATLSNPDYLAIIEGRANPLDYGSVGDFIEQGQQIFYRGYIQFCSVSNGTTSTGARFLDGVQTS